MTNYKVKYNNKTYKTSATIYKYYRDIDETYYDYSSISNDANTLLLLHADDYTDSSQYKHNILSASGVTINTTLPKIGKGCIYFDGSKCIKLPTISFGTSDFTFDTWVYLLSMPTSDSWPSSWSSHMVICGVGTPGSGDGIDFILGSTRIMMHNNDNQFIYGTHGMTTGNWYHLAAVRNGNNFMLFVDGVMKASVTTSITAGTGSYFWIGCETGEGAYFKGYMDEFRVSNIARWTANFTPDTSPYEADSNTLILNHFDAITDYTVSVNPNNTKFGSGSFYFNGSNSYLLCDSINGLAKNKFTIDWWEYPTTDNANGGVRFCSSFAGNNCGGLLLGYNGTALYASTTETGNSWDIFSNQTAFSITQNTWTHWAVVRNDDKWYTFRNGKLFWSGTNSSNVGSGNTNACIGEYRTGETKNFVGFIDEFRISNIARWTSNFTPPTESYKYYTAMTRKVPQETNILYGEYSVGTNHDYILIKD